MSILWMIIIGGIAGALARFSFRATSIRAASS